MSSTLIGKKVDLKDWDGRLCCDWGIVKDYDGEYYWIAFAGDDNDVKPYVRNEFVVRRSRR